MTEVDLDAVSKNIANILMENAAKELASSVSQARIQERANEIIRDLLEHLEETASQLAERRISERVEARAEEILTARATDVERLANERAKHKIDSLADELALQIAGKKAREFARARAAAILDESTDQVEAYADAFVKECAIRAFLMEHEDEIHSTANALWRKSAQ